MKCDNCGAPLAIVEGRDYFRCSYCATVCFPTESTATADRVTSLETQADAICPLCAVHLIAGAMDGRPVRHCSTCRGVLLTSDDFAEIVRSRRETYAGPVAAPVALNPAELKRRLNCPSCGEPMDTHPYYGPGSVVVDSCGSCRSVWLDHGEMTTIEEAPGRR
ncbi:MAG: zf-TFIIB domain-containing protein [bacterium]|nr:zf-TFIIB domain-containing protein [bacterium]